MHSTIKNAHIMQTYTHFYKHTTITIVRQSRQNISIHLSLFKYSAQVAAGTILRLIESY